MSVGSLPKFGELTEEAAVTAAVDTSAQVNVIGHLTSCNCASCHQLPMGVSTIPWPQMQPSFAPGGISVSSIPTISAEEKKELEELKVIRAAEDKRVKLESFKKLAADFRQRVIDSIIWEREVQKIGVLEAPKSDRERELEAKWDPSSLSSFGYGNTLKSYIGMSGLYDPTQHAHGVKTPIPAGLTAEDLIQAHNDACMEEAIYNEAKDEQAN